MRSAAVWLVLMMSGGPAWAQTPDCATPRAAAASLFEHLDPNPHEPSLAATCLDLPDGANGARMAVQLKQVLDARGHYVPVATMPDDPNFTDEDGQSVVVPMHDFPTLAFVKGADGKWRWSRQTLDALPSLYSNTFSPVSVWFQSALPEVFYTRVLGLFLWQMVYAGLLVGIAMLVGALFRTLARGQASRLAKRFHIALDDRLWDSMASPLGGVVVLGVLSWGLSDIQLPIALSSPLSKVLLVGLWVSGVLAAFRGVALAASMFARIAEKTDSKLDDQAIPMLRQAGQAVVMVLGMLYTADAIGFDVWKLAAGVGIGGLAFALAAQDTVANLFGSINIFLDRPFQIGDWVQVDGVEGVIEEVGFRSTRVRTFANSLVTIPNSKITNANVDNLGLRPRRRIKMTLGLTYDTPPEKLQAYAEGVRAILAAHPYVQRTYEVHVYNLGSSAIEILVYYHVVTPGWSEELATRAQNILEFMRLADELGVSFAFPSQSLYLEATPDRPMAPHAETTIQQLQHIVDSFGPQGANARPEGPEFSKSWTVAAREERGSAE